MCNELIVNNNNVDNSEPIVCIQIRIVIWKVLMLFTGLHYSYFSVNEDNTVFNNEIVNNEKNEK